MITLDVEQGTDAWLAARSGIPTASEFKSIITSQGKESTSKATYMYKLLAEWLMGGPVETFQSEWMQRGTSLEPEARNFYQFAYDVEVKQVGLIYKDERKLVSCSPDGLIGDKGGYECKCPAPHTHVKYLLANKLPAEYKPQVMGSLWITDREYWDFMSHYPGIKPLIVRVERDEKYISLMEEIIEKFISDMLKQREQLKEYAQAA